MNMQIVELHFSAHPGCDYAAVKARAEALLGEKLDSPDAGTVKQAFMLFHKEHALKYRDGAIPAQTVLLSASKPIDLNAYNEIIQQSWGFSDCVDVLKASTHTIMVTEMMASSLPAMERVRLFHGVLQAVIELTSPIALVFMHSQQVVRPQAYLERIADEPILRPGPINVRFFNIANSSGDFVMDTRGLEEIGLNDLQCHFRDLDPNDVGAVLFDAGVYVFKEGPVIESGNTVAGIEAGSKWQCQFENALVPPDREVLDLNPGAPYAAGNRD